MFFDERSLGMVLEVTRRFVAAIHETKGRNQ